MSLGEFSNFKKCFICKYSCEFSIFISTILCSSSTTLGFQGVQLSSVQWLSRVRLFVTQLVKTSPATAEVIRDPGSIPGLGRSPGGRHGSPPQYSCLENSMDSGAWWATVHRVTKSQTELSNFHFQGRNLLLF